jgi:hypothetical protein
MKQEDPRKGTKTIKSIRPWGDIHPLVRNQECSVDLTHIKPGMKHRFWAVENDFRMVVVCFGEWTAEDQIRHADDYGREGKKLEI